MRYSFVADHFQYVASMGLIALFSGALVQKFSPRWQPLPPALRLTVLVLCFGNLWMSVRREAWKFRNLDALWQDTLAKNPSAALAHNDLAALAIARGDWASAPMHLQQALTLQPALAQAHYNEGRLLQHNGRLPEAVVEFSRAVLLESQQPDYQNALAAAWLLEGKTKAARAVVENALRLWPDDAKLHTTKDALSKS
jgi:tetratricopeptide (TPR) repeat protein